MTLTGAPPSHPGGQVKAAFGPGGAPPDRPADRSCSPVLLLPALRAGPSCLWTISAIKEGAGLRFWVSQLVSSSMRPTARRQLSANGSSHGPPCRGVLYLLPKFFEATPPAKARSFLGRGLASDLIRHIVPMGGAPELAASTSGHRDNPTMCSPYATKRRRCFPAQGKHMA